MTPRERQERARRAARRGPVYDAIGFGVILAVATLAAGPLGLAFMLAVSAALLVLGLLVGVIRGPEKPPAGPEEIPPA